MSRPIYLLYNVMFIYSVGHGVLNIPRVRASIYAADFAAEANSIDLILIHPSNLSNKLNQLTE